jgi:N-acetyl-anhydromuramyl-L-alanine amidase AmpD
MRLPAKWPWWVWLAIAVLPFSFLTGGIAVLVLKIRQKSAHPSNVGGTRNVDDVDTIVVHTVEGTAKSALSWFAVDHAKFLDDHGKPMRPSSAHYVVGKDGTVTNMVPEGRIAWHASDSAVNRRSIGIECEGAAADAKTWTPELLAALGQLCADIADRYNIPATRSSPGIIGHQDVPAAVRLQGKVDPGPHFPWLAFLADVAARRAAARVA